MTFRARTVRLTLGAALTLAGLAAIIPAWFPVTPGATLLAMVGALAMGFGLAIVCVAMLSPRTESGGIES